MIPTDRRSFLGGLAFAAGAAAATPALGQDGHAAGYDVAPAADHMPLIARKSGDPVVFTTSLDKAPIKATSGGWAREITTRTLPIATGIAGAHLYLNPGGVREMHWHNSAEWGYILSGYCQIVVIDPDGQTEVANYAPGDLWFFPAGHAHSVQALGPQPCHAILAFDDGLFGEHGTFGLSDWMSRLDPAMLSGALGISKKIPAAEVYIMQGAVLGRDSPQARRARELGPRDTHRHRLMDQTPLISSPGGELYLASKDEYPISTTMTGFVLRLKPGAMHEPHWHLNANEWHYVARGRIRVTLFATDKRLAVAELGIGDCAYIPRGCGHIIQNIGPQESEIVGALDNGRYQESSLSDWIRRAPSHVLAANLGLAEEDFERCPDKAVIIAAG